MKKYFIALVLLCIFFNAFATPKGKSPAVLIFADISGYVLKDEFTSDVNGDGQEEQIQLLHKPTDDIFANFTLRILKDNQSFDLGKIILAPKEYCSIEEIIISPDHKPLIGVSYPVGGHSEWLGIYSFNGEFISEINNMFSDGPSIAIADLDNDGVKDIEIVNRDYDNNPVKDSYIETYKYKNGKFREVSVYRTNPGEYLALGEKEEQEATYNE
ncbi:hypothetical protein ACFL5Y_02245 [Candidatus Omnitrophota bacterium]